MSKLQSSLGFLHCKLTIRFILELITFIGTKRRPKFTIFVKEHKTSFKTWHSTPKSMDDLERIWKRCFETEAQRLSKEVKVVITNSRLPCGDTDRALVVRLSRR